MLDCITVGFEKPPHIYGMHTLRLEEDVEGLAKAYLQSATRLGKPSSEPPLENLKAFGPDLDRF